MGVMPWGCHIVTTRVLLGLARPLRFTLAGVLGAALLAACASTGQTVRVPWRAGNAESFQMGAVEERRAHAAQGVLPVTEGVSDLLICYP